MSTTPLTEIASPANANPLADAVGTSVRTECATWRVPSSLQDGGCRRIAPCWYTARDLVLQHIRTVRVRQRGPPSTMAIDPTATPAELPDRVRRDLEHRSDDPLVNMPDPLAETAEVAE